MLSVSTCFVGFQSIDYSIVNLKFHLNKPTPSMKAQYKCINLLLINLSIQSVSSVLGISHSKINFKLNPMKN